MSAQTTNERTHDAPRRRPHSPARDPDTAIRPRGTAGEGPSDPGLEKDGSGLYWVVLHCTYEVKSH